MSCYQFTVLILSSNDFISVIQLQYKDFNIKIKMSTPNDESYPAGYKPVFYVKLPRTLYVKYIEAWYHFSGSGLTKERAQFLANEDWRKSSDDEKHKLIQKHVRSIRKRKKNTLFSFGVYKKAQKSDAVANTTDTVNDVGVMVTGLSGSGCPSASGPSTSIPSGSDSSGLSPSNSSPTNKYMETANASTAAIDNDSYLFSHQYSSIDIFLASLDNNCRRLLDDPSLKTSNIVIAALTVVSKVYNPVHSLLELYEKGKQKRRESTLSKTLSEIYNKRNELKTLILEALDINIDPVLGLGILKANAERKELLFKDIAISCLSFKSFINDKDIKRSLQRRVSQIEKKKSPSVSENTVLVCKNNSKLTWEEAFSNLTGDVNSYDMDVYNTGILLQNSAILQVKEHLSEVKTSSKEMKKFIWLLLDAFPLMYLTNIKGEEYIVNHHQTSNDGNELSELIYRNEEKDDVENHTSSSTKSTSKASQ